MHGRRFSAAIPSLIKTMANGNQLTKLDILHSALVTQQELLQAIMQAFAQDATSADKSRNAMGKPGRGGQNSWFGFFCQKNSG